MPEVSTPVAVAAPAPFEAGHVLDFARAFRAAARAVSFYPPTHPAVRTTLQGVTGAASTLTAVRPLILTILPTTVLAAGLPIEGPEQLAAELADVLHRHGVGALTVNARATAETWRALAELLARRPEDLRATGGIQRHWMAGRHAGAHLLEIDFGEMLRGRVGGDFAELAAVLNFYLETGVSEEAVEEDLFASLVRALEAALDDEAAVTAVLRQVRAAASVTRASHPERLDDLFRRAAMAAERMRPAVMAGLLASRGTSDARVGSIDVVASMVERMTDATIAGFLQRAMADGPSTALSTAFVDLVPDPDRRARLLTSSRDAARMEDGTLEQWEAFALSLESLSDRQYVSAQYERELESARERSTDGALVDQDPPERVAAWVGSIDETSVHELDVLLLIDLASVETDTGRWRDLVPVLEQYVLDSAQRGEWQAAFRVLEALAAEAGRGFDEGRRQAALDALQRIADAPACAQALQQVADGTASWLESSRFLMSVGASIVPALVRTRVRVVDPEAVERLDAIVAAYGKEGRDALRRLLSTPDPDLRIAAMRMLGHTRTTEHLPSLEGMLTDAHSGVRQEALRTLVGAESLRGQEILARGMARADEAGQMALLDQVVSLGAARAVPALHHLLTRLDQRTAAPEVYLAIIAALRRAGTPDAVAAIEEVFRQTQWTVPLRAMRFRSAARAAIDAVGGEAGTAALRRMSVFHRMKSARPVTDSTAPQGKVDAT